MCNQNIISNKFDLKLVTTFSSYWCTAIFTKSRSLHYVLKKQRKSTKTIKSENDTEERNDTFQIDHIKRKRCQEINDAHPQAKKRRLTRKKTTHKEHMTLPEQQNADRNRTSISAFQNGNQNNDENNDHRPHSKDLRNYRSFYKRN